MEVLLKGGADPNAATRFGTSPYCYAPTRDPEIMDMLLKTKKYPDNSNAFVDAIASGNLEMVKKLYPRSGKLVEDPKLLIEIAVNFAYDDIIRYLCGKYDVGKEDYEKLLAQSQTNKKRYAEFNNRHKTLSNPPLVKDKYTGKKGYYTYKLARWSSYPQEKPDPYLSTIPVSVYVPEKYSDKKPAGIIIYISGKYPGKGYKKVIDDRNLIWAGIDCYKFKLNDIPLGKRPHEVFTPAMVYDLMRHYTIVLMVIRRQSKYNRHRPSRLAPVLRRRYRICRRHRRLV